MKCVSMEGNVVEFFGGRNVVTSQWPLAYLGLGKHSGMKAVKRSGRRSCVGEVWRIGGR